MSKYRKMLDGSGEGVEKLMRFIEKQSLKTLVKWTTDYAERRKFLTICEVYYRTRNIKKERLHRLLSI